VENFILTTRTAVGTFTQSHGTYLGQYFNFRTAVGMTHESFHVRIYVYVYIYFPAGEQCSLAPARRKIISTLVVCVAVCLILRVEENLT